MSKTQIGYDGLVPEFREARDLDGRGKRQAATGPTNVNVDMLAFLEARGTINAGQRGAGRIFQRDSELAQLVSYGTLQGGRDGQGLTRLPDAKCDAIARVNRARAHVGPNNCAGWRVIELVALERANLSDVEARMGLRRGKASGILTAALDALMAHYGARMDQLDD